MKGYTGNQLLRVKTGIKAGFDFDKDAMISKMTDLYQVSVDKTSEWWNYMNDKLTS
jgi:hypothetical protein